MFTITNKLRMLRCRPNASAEHRGKMAESDPTEGGGANIPAARHDAPILLVLAATAVALSACGGNGSQGNAIGNGNQGSAILTASPAKQSFQRNEPVGINLTLSNPTNAPIGVSTFVRGTLIVFSLERDGKPVAPRNTVLQMYEDLRVLVRSHLTTLAARQSLSFSARSTFDQGAGGQAFYAVRIAGLTNPLGVYPLAAPGRYVLKLQYQYPAEAAPSGSTFMGTTNAATVSFDVAA
jgi:hypothetical protein